MRAALHQAQKNTPWKFQACTLSILSSFLPLAWCAQGACLLCFAELRKNTPLETWSMYLACLGCLEVMVPLP
jgi:hypothetical protein